MEPLSLVIGGAILGGAAGKFTEKAYDSGSRWISSYFKDHAIQSEEQAKVNGLDFLTELASRIKLLEESNVVSKERIESAQDRPDFSALLKKALLNSAETSSNEKHKLLATVVAEKLKSSEESTLSLASKIACDAISGASINQIKILALQVNLLDISPTSIPLDLASSDQIQKWFRDWLIRRLIVFHDLAIKPIDLLHLDTLSCGRLNNFLVQDLVELLSHKISSRGLDGFQFDAEVFKRSSLGQHVFDLWDNHNLTKLTLTSAGKIVGVYASDLLTGQPTNLDGFE
jgi:hypothetical protein